MLLEYNVRRATRDDINAIADLSYLQNAQGFGNKRSMYGGKDALFKSYQTVRLVVETRDAGEKTVVVAYAELRNYPAIGSLPSDSWLEWIQERYCIEYPISWVNTLFFTYCIYDKDHPNALLQIQREAFFIENRISYLIAVKMPTLRENSGFYAETFTDLEKNAKIFYPREFSIQSNPNTQCLYIVHRYGLLAKINYRKALAEDNDDIVEIHECEFPEMREELGDFYIAEELMRHDQDAKNNVLIVAETEDDNKEQTTSGFLWLEANVDIRFYVKNYEMESFGNLMSVNYSKPYAFETISVLSVEPKPEATLFTADAMNDLEGMTIIGGMPMQDSATSVASASLFKVSSIQGQIIISNSSETLEKFCMVEAIYLKFMLIFEKLTTINYYINQRKTSINLCYNKDHPGIDGVQSATNVFVLRFICARKNFPLERLFNFLCAMFSMFPDRDYCIMVMPTSTKPLRSHLEALKYFMPVAQRPSEMSNLDEVYITHRSTIFGEISLYRLEKEDVETIRRLALNLKIDGDHAIMSYSSSFSYSSKVNTQVHADNEVHVIEQIMTDVLENPHSEFDVFTIRCGNSSRPAHENTSIGFVIIRRFLYHADLLRHYHLPKDDYHLEHERAEIITLKLHPLFYNSCDLIFRSLAGRTNYFDYYFFFCRKANIFSNDLKTLMMIVEPKQRKQNIFGRKRSEQKSRKAIDGLPSNDFYDDHITVFRHKLNPSKFFGNSNRLVIIGFSPECRAFLRQLLFLWNSKDHKNSEVYTCLPRLHVTVIAGPGQVEAEYECTFACPDCSSADARNCFIYNQNGACYVRDVVARMDLRYWVQFITGHVNYIDRGKKLVRINKTCDIFYDTLMLMNSVDFNLQHSLRGPQRPYNFIELNHRLDRFIMFYKVRVLLEELKRSYRILIFGGNLSTYECIDFLLTHGVDPVHVILVQPREPIPSENEQKFKNPLDDTNIDFVLDDMMSDLNLTIHRDFTFSHWVQHASSNFILEVVFTDGRKNELRIDCDLFISFKVGYMEPNVKKYLISSDINLKNNRILVNKNFQTNDPDIYAAGKFIEMNEFVNHQYRFVSEMETAEKVSKRRVVSLPDNSRAFALQLIHIMGFRVPNKPIDEKYSCPAFFRAKLPMNHYITKVTMPRRYLFSCVVRCKNCTLTTYHQNTFCRISLSQKMIVDEIVVVMKNATSLDYLEHFCGKHETLLNHLKANYKNRRIKCFLKFLQKPWTELLMHDDFDDFQRQNHRILMPMIKSLETVRQLTDIHLQEVNNQILEQNVIDFVRENRDDFHHEFALPEDYVGDDWLQDYK
ncbi:hypothetical protein KR093_004626 [Drosophila rubida]|uniref:Cilia- and flagella-associated protein 61 N-terminal domain-containing protein n=1 Tax=Drosophila rubida TaxID=30044 RepID=A0AAD4JZB2_9MUSC|nr:hypothetical protein KR093_004626 [Drosophila rubida]